MARLGKPLIAAVNGDAHAGGFGVVVACDLAVAADDATLGLPEAAKGLFPFIALAIVRDALPKKVLFDLDLLGAPHGCGRGVAMQIVNEVRAARSRARARRRARGAPAATTRDRRTRPRPLLRMRGAPPTRHSRTRERALLAALAAVNRSGARRAQRERRCARRIQISRGCRRRLKRIPGVGRPDRAMEVSCDTGHARMINIHRARGVARLSVAVQDRGDDIDDDSLICGVPTLDPSACTRPPGKRAATRSAIARRRDRRNLGRQPRTRARTARSCDFDGPGYLLVRSKPTH